MAPDVLLFVEGEPAMPKEMPLHVLIPVSSFPHRSALAPRWTARRVIPTLLAIWAAVAALLVAIVVAIAWDMRP